MAQRLTRAQELVYELTIEQVMTSKVVTVAPDCSMSELKEVLRVNKISGVPVVQNDELVGIISIEDLIRALEEGELSATVGDRMTTAVQVVRADDSAVSAVNLFASLRYGRFPVMDADGKLVGILTQGDIVRGLLRQMEVQWQAEEIRRYRASHIFEDIESDETSLVLRYLVTAHDFSRGGEASRKIKRALQHLGAHPRVVRRVTVAVYEAEMNLIIHSSGGEIIAEVESGRIKVTAIDEGPGIPNIEEAMQPGFTTAPEWIRQLGFGAGMGLSNIKSCTDEMKLDSEVGVGTCLEMTFNVD
ncbi:MAG: hypothetical protein A2Y73_04905 [Chloroflexi bacterium RBG_13_56_8]|nr:MAG: hypothetical protein A2Y73_04905 [Chloroflexi bacterium RBG_13_56_8]